MYMMIIKVKVTLFQNKLYTGKGKHLIFIYIILLTQPGNIQVICEYHHTWYVDDTLYYYDIIIQLYVSQIHSHDLSLQQK